ncbi:serine/threonine-protein kinase [Nonomuraea insulae]|uniref:non-specific serine/threonine protein kinase n=1 Tax=Nonomuraea insulae TaxID=1616787 RepID=A0ABW1D3Q1_9ACTN
MRFLQRCSGSQAVAVHPGLTVDRRYRLVRRLARGQSGEVWLARDLELGRDVALKRVAVEGGAAGFDRLWAEARALARFSHPHVVTLYHAVRAGPRRRATSWLVMEHVPGGSLEGRPGLPAGVAARIGAQIADALAALHAEGIVHCDLKPGNVVVTGEGTAKLADFGAAYRVGGAETITPNSAVSYTPDYAAPEVVRGQPEPKSDVFSLGAMVYALVAGRPPRRGGARPTDGQEAASGRRPDGGGPPDSVEAYITVREAARGAVTLDADVGPLAGVLAGMLRRDPDERPDAAQARRRLEEVASPPGPIPALAQDLDAKPDPGGLPALVRGIPALVRSRRPILAGAAVALVAALALWQWGGDWIQLPSPPTGGTPAAGGAITGSRSPAVQGVLGDRRTADPCALLEPASLARFGSTDLDPDYGNFDRCDVLVSPPSDAVVDVRLDLNLDPPPEQAKAARTTKVVTVVEDPAESDACSRTLVLAGVTDTTITVTAKRDEKGRAPLCEIADAATTHAVETLNEGRIPRRDPGFPPESLANQDACTLLHAQALEVVPGIDAADPDRGYGGWDCEWESTTSDIWVDLTFDRGPTPNAEGGTATRLHGFPAFVRPEAEGEGTCLVNIVYRTYIDGHSQTAAETLLMLVGGSRPVDRLCRMATDLAGSAAAELPRA